MSPTRTPNLPASSSSSSSSSSFSVWLLQYMKFKIFARIRRLLHSKTAKRNISSSSSSCDHENHQSDKPRDREICNNDEYTVGEKQSSVQKDDDQSVVLQRAVKWLHFGSWEEKEKAAIEIERVAKEDARIRKLMAELGVVRVLVSIVAEEAVGRRRAAVRALIQLAHGTYTNKALMVEAGICSKLPKKVEVLDESLRHEFSELLLSLSSLANAQFPVASTEILPFLIGMLDSSSRLETKETCLGALYNISLVLENSGPLVSNGAVQTLLRLIWIKELSEKSLATLSQLVVTQMGKKAMEDSSLAPEGLIEILTWEEKPKCQEISAYILMILAHQSSSQREKMDKAGIVPVLLQVVLLGTPLAQKRAVKLLQWFKDERQEKVAPHSGPQTGRVSPAMASPMSPRSAQEGKRMMKSLVKQSLYKNMEMITQRANANGEREASSLKALVISTSSKSLPY